MAIVAQFKRYQLFRTGQTVTQFLDDLEKEIDYLAAEHDRLSDLVLNAEILSQVEIYWNKMKEISERQNDLYIFMMQVMDASLEYVTY